MDGSNMRKIVLLMIMIPNIIIIAAEYANPMNSPPPNPGPRYVPGPKNHHNQTAEIRLEKDLIYLQCKTWAHMTCRQELKDKYLKGNYVREYVLCYKLKAQECVNKSLL